MEINGIKYIKREENHDSFNKMSKEAKNFMLMASMYGGLSDIKDHALDGVDIEKEFENIQNKNSNLSSNMRSRVVNRFHNTYRVKE